MTFMERPKEITSPLIQATISEYGIAPRLGREISVGTMALKRCVFGTVKLSYSCDRNTAIIACANHASSRTVGFEHGTLSGIPGKHRLSRHCPMSLTTFRKTSRQIDWLVKYANPDPCSTDYPATSDTVDRYPSSLLPLVLPTVLKCSIVPVNTQSRSFELLIPIALLITAPFR